MQEAYKNIDIQFLPNRIINQSPILESSVNQISSNLVLSTNSSDFLDINSSITSFVHHLSSFF